MLMFVFPAIPVFLWWIIGGIASLFVISGIIIACSPEPVKGHKMAVLGMMMSGKTTLYAHLRGEDYTSYEGTTHQRYEAFSFKINERTIYVAEGEDIGGGEEFCHLYYDRMISENEIIFFTFNAYEYLNDCSYQAEVNVRFDFINRKRNGKDTVIIGTYLDKFTKKQQKTLLQDLLKEVQSKEYEEMFRKNVFIIDMRERKAVMEIAEKIFK